MRAIAALHRRDPRRRQRLEKKDESVSVPVQLYLPKFRQPCELVGERDFQRQDRWLPRAAEGLGAPPSPLPEVPLY